MVARPLALGATVAVSLLAVAGSGGAATQQAPKRGGTLVVGTRTASEPVCLNPFACGLPAGAVAAFVRQVLPGAFEVLPDGTLRSELADAEIVATRPFTVVYRIRPEARWSDGVPVGARDFVFTQRMLRRYEPADFSLGSEQVRRIRALDPKTLRVVLRARYADWRSDLFTIVLPRHVFAGESFKTAWRDGIENPRTGRPVGSGPFLVADWRRGSQLTLVRNPRYWGLHRAYLDRILVRFYPPEDTADALRRGDIDMIDPGPAVLQAQALELHRQRVPGVTVSSQLASFYENFVIRVGRGGHPALRIRAVRQALALGIDRVAIARQVGDLTLAGRAAREPMDSAVYLKSSPSYEPHWSRYRFQPQRARRLLEQAGCRPGADGIYVCADGRLSLRFATAAGVEARELTVKLAQAQLRQIGIDVVPVFAPPSVLFGPGGILGRGDFDVMLFAWILGPSKAGIADVFRCQADDNVTGYCDRLMTRDLVQVTQMLDDERRAELLNRIDARLARAVPSIPLYQGTGLFAFAASVRGIVRNGVGSDFWNVEDWWLDR